MLPRLSPSDRLAVLLFAAMVFAWLVPLLPGPVAILAILVGVGCSTLGALPLLHWIAAGPTEDGRPPRDDLDLDDTPGGAA